MVIIPRRDRKRHQVYLKYKGRCAYCGNEIGGIDRMHMDHITPQCKSDNLPEHINKNDLENLNPSCARCNLFKHSWNLEEFREAISKINVDLLDIGKFNIALDYGMISIKDFDGRFYFEKVADDIAMLEEVIE